MSVNRYLQLPIVFVIFLIIVFTVIKKQDDKQVVVTNQAIHVSLQHASREQKNSIQRYMETQVRHLQFLSDTPPIQGIYRAQINGGIDAFDGNSIDIWKSRLAIIFESLIGNYDDILQIRMLDVPTGREIIRVNQRNSQITRTPQDKLQDKKQTTYFKRTIQLSENGIYISELDLNKENGKIEYPVQPVVRFSTPIYNQTGDLFAILVLNVSPKPLTAELQSISAALGFKFALLDHSQQIIEHYNKQLQYSKDLNPQSGWDKIYQTTDWKIADVKIIQEKSTGKKYIAHESVVRASSNNLGDVSQFILVNLLDYDEYQTMLVDKRLANLGYLAITIIIFVIIFVIFVFYLRSAAELKKTRTEFEAIFEGASDGIIALDKRLSIVSYNQSALHFFPELKQNTKPILFTELVSVPATLVSELNLALSDYKKVSTAEIQLGQSYVRVSTSPILSSSKMVVGRALFIQDISDQKRFEKEIQNINLSLEEQIRERTAELNAEKTKAVDASKIKSAFVSTISHEMRTPLNGILGALKLIYREPHKDKVKTLLDMMHSSANSLSSLVNDVLDLSKIEAGKLELRETKFNPIHVVEEVVSALSAQAYTKGIDLEIDVSEVKHHVFFSDSSRLAQILNNLVGNAIKFTVEGGVYISGRSFSEADKTYLEIDILDTGIGIELANQNKLFGAFEQAEESISSKFGGTGLGLSISRQLCELLGGHISFVSTKDIGSKFTFVIGAASDKCQVRPKVDILNGKKFSLLLSNSFLIEKWRGVVTVLGGGIVADHSITPDYYLVDVLHEQYDNLRQQPEVFNKCIVLSKHSDQTINEKNMFAYLGRPTRIASFVSIFSDHKETLALFHQSSNLEVDSEASFPELQGKIFLVVDDNKINVEIASHHIRLVKGKVIKAYSGLEAIEKLQHAAASDEQIDAILMDCQMPIMDGYEATSKIRSGDAGSKNRQIPIIALTANAMAGEREKCLKLGMNEYLTKPIEANKLFPTLTYWLTAKPNQSGGDNKDIVDAADTLEARLNSETALSRLMGDLDLYKELLTMFIDSSQGDVNALKEFIEREDFNGLAQLGHTIKGVASNLGANELQRLCSQLESTARQSGFEICRNLVFDIENEIEYLQHEIKRFIDEN